MKYDVEVAAAIRHWAPAYGVTIDPKLVHAIIQKESSHTKLVTAEPGNRYSYGPMMVLDSTARGFGILSPETLKAPALGIYWGVRYLAEQLKRFRGDTAAAISAYNTGPGNARRNKAGRFPNQPYVDAVRGWWRIYGGGAVGAGAMVLGLTVGAFLLLRSLRRRGAR